MIDAVSAREGGPRTHLRNFLAFDPPDARSEIFLIAPKTLTLGPLSSAVQRVDVPEWLAKPIPRVAWERTVLTGLLRRLRPDVFFCPGGTVLGSPPEGCVTVTMSRNMLPFDDVARLRYPPGYTRARTRVLKQLLLRSMMRADLVIFVSHYAEAEIGALARNGLRRSTVIPHGVSQEFQRLGMPPRPGWLPPEDYILYVSNLEPYKCQKELVQAFSRLRADPESKVTEKLVLVGPESRRSYARDVRAEIDRLGLANDVVVAGAVPHVDLVGAYRHARVGVFASQCENCPNILLEAMASGQAMAVSRHPPMPEFAKDAVLYFEPTDVSDTADKLGGLLADASLREDLGRRAREQASLFDARETARRSWDAMYGLLDDTRHSARSEADRSD